MTISQKLRIAQKILFMQRKLNFCGPKTPLLDGRPQRPNTIWCEMVQNYSVSPHCASFMSRWPHSLVFNQSSMWNISIQCTNSCIQQMNCGSLVLLGTSKHSEDERLWFESVAYISYPLKRNAFTNAWIYNIRESKILMFLSTTIIINLFIKMSQISNIWLFM